MTSPDDIEEADEVSVNAGRLWAGGIATALVAGLVVVAGVFIARAALGIQVPAPGRSGSGSDPSTAVYAGLAACSALLATALLHILLLAAPRPLAFFGWITTLATVVAAVVPFTQHAPLSSRISTAIINLIVGVAVISLLSAVGRSAAHSAAQPDLGQTSQRPQNNYGF